jgi:hypothetical protein
MVENVQESSAGPVSCSLRRRGGLRHDVKLPRCYLLPDETRLYERNMAARSWKRKVGSKLVRVESCSAEHVQVSNIDNRECFSRCASMAVQRFKTDLYLSYQASAPMLDWRLIYNSSPPFETAARFVRPIHAVLPSLSGCTILTSGAIHLSRVARLSFRSSLLINAIAPSTSLLLHPLVPPLLPSTRYLDQPFPAPPIQDVVPDLVTVLLP